MFSFIKPRGSPFDEDVELATNEKDESENWSQIMKICDKTVNYEEGAKFCFQSIIKRMSNSNQNVVLHTLNLLDACVKNCGESFHAEVASEQFIAVVKKLLHNGSPPVVDKLKHLLKIWAEGSFKDNPKLCIIPSFYYKLKSDGLIFPSTPETSSKDLQESIQKEKDDIDKAIELSLKDTGRSFVQCDQATFNQNSDKLLKVQALYDFESAEPDELSFKTGEIILVLDNRDPNWWMGSSQHGDGMFPRSFVTELSTEEVEGSDLQTDQSSQASTLSASETHVKGDESKDSKPPLVEIKIDKAKINYTLYMLDLADPTGEIPDSDELKALEEQCHVMSPLIEEKLQEIDSNLAALMSANKDIMSALGMYFEVTKKPEESIHHNSSARSLHNPSPVQVPSQIPSMQSPASLLQQNKNSKLYFPPRQTDQLAQQISYNGSGISQSSGVGNFIPNNSIPVSYPNRNVSLQPAAGIDAASDYASRSVNNNTVLKAFKGLNNNESSQSSVDQTVPKYPVSVSSSTASYNQALTNGHYKAIPNLNVRETNAFMYTNFPSREITTVQPSPVHSTMINSHPSALAKGYEYSSGYAPLPSNNMASNTWSLQNPVTCNISHGVHSAENPVHYVSYAPVNSALPETTNAIENPVHYVSYAPVNSALPETTNAIENAVLQVQNSDADPLRKNEIAPEYNVALSDLSLNQKTVESLSTETSITYPTCSASYNANISASQPVCKSYSVPIQESEYPNHNISTLKPPIASNAFELSDNGSTVDMGQCVSNISGTSALPVPSLDLENAVLPCHNSDTESLQGKQLSSKNISSEPPHAIKIPALENSTSSKISEINYVNSKVTPLQTVSDNSSNAVDFDIFSSPVNHSPEPLQPQKS